MFVGSALTLQPLIDSLYERGVHVGGLCYPVVPEGQARARLDVTAKHTDEQICRTLRVFEPSGSRSR